ncbi:MAG: homing endonuclease associated repeat-containing protein [Gaiellaceae bacterium]
MSALREAAELAGHSPGKNEYEALRMENRQFGWPAAASIRTWLGGSWNDCLGRAHLDSVPDGDAIVMELGLTFTREEAIDALRSCVADLGYVPSVSQYIGWSRRPDVRRAPGRRPNSLSPFCRLFGSYLNALVSAGLFDSESNEFAGVGPSRYRSAVYAYTDEQLLDALREVAQRLGRTPLWDEYQRERQVILEESAAAGRPRMLPTLATTQRRFGTLNAALETAGLDPHVHLAPGSVKGRRPVHETAPRPSHPKIEAALREAYVDVGDPFLLSAYQAWREQKYESDPRARFENRYPTYAVIRARYGRWSTAVDAALAARGDDDDDQAAAAVPA